MSNSAQPIGVMNMATGTTRGTFGSLLNAVSTAGNAAAGVLDQINVGNELLGNWTSKLLKEQQKSHKADALVFDVELEARTITRLTAAQETIAKLSAKSPESAKAVTDALAKYREHMGTNE